MVSVRELSKHYASNVVLNNINISLSDKSIHFLMGKNGSGKTTFIKCLLNLEEFSGSIMYDGKALNNIRSSVFAIFDDIPLYSNLTGFQNIRLMVDSDEKFDITRITQYGLLSHKKLKERVKHYSLGEKKKLSLLAAMLINAQILVVDEISNGLDIESLETLKECLRELSKSSLILATGHHFEFYEQIIDDLLVLHNGTIIQITDFQKGGVTLHEVYKQYIANS